MEIELSLQELMTKAFNLSLDACYAETAPNGSYLETRKEFPSEDFESMIFGYSDGLMEKCLHNHITGRCSLNAMIQFDIEAFEKQVEKDIDLMQTFIAIKGLPVRLSFAEMRSRGYRGEWAGMNESGEIVK